MNKQCDLSSLVCEPLLEWQRFYREVFNRDFDPTSVTLFEEREGFGWVIVVIPDLTDNQVYDKCKERFPSWRYYKNLDKVIIHNDRTAENGPYAIRVRDGIEADQQHRNLSANEAIKRGIKGLTFKERGLQQLWHHWKTDNHLDSKSGTICSGSRYSGGYFVHVCWHGGKFNVCHIHPDDGVDDYGVREQVS